MEPQSLTRSEMSIIEQGRRWQLEGERVVLATVAHTWGSSPRPTGAVMVLSESGRFLGSVSGGCIEEELIERVMVDFPLAFETLEYSSDTTRSLPCGGRLLLTLEPLDSLPDLDSLLAELAAGRAVLRRIELATGSASWKLAEAGTRSALNDAVLELVYEPLWKLLVVGGGELAQWVCRQAALLDYSILVCDPRAEYQQAWPLSEPPCELQYPDDFIQAHGVDERTAVVALTHDPKVDDMAMLEALASHAFYIGALGSRRTTAKRAERLRDHFSVDAEALARIRGPIGIDLNSRRPQDIALAVMTDITAARNGVVITCQRREA